jgi:predicted  nucleic acid-binding Zn-ribbon protein
MSWSSHPNGNNTYFLCACCGQQRKKTAEHVTCYPCHQEYAGQAAKALASGNPAVSSAEWALSKAKTLLDNLNQKLKGKSQKLDQVKEQAKEEAFSFIKGNATKFIERDVFQAAMDAKNKELYRQKGGSKLFAEVKTLEETIRSIRAEIKRLEKQLAEEESQQDSEVEEIASPA